MSIAEEESGTHGSKRHKESCRAVVKKAREIARKKREKKDGHVDRLKKLAALALMRRRAEAGRDPVSGKQANPQHAMRR